MHTGSVQLQMLMLILLLLHVELLLLLLLLLHCRLSGVQLLKGYLLRPYLEANRALTGSYTVHLVVSLYCIAFFHCTVYFSIFFHYSCCCKTCAIDTGSLKATWLYLTWLDLTWTCCQLRCVWWTTVHASQASVEDTLV